MRRCALIAVLLLFNSPVLAQEDGEEARSLSHIVGSGKRVFMLGLLSEGQYLSDNGYWYEACVAYNGIIERGEESEGYYRQAQFGIAENLLKLGLAYSAFTYLARIVDAGPGHPRYADVLPQLVEIHRLLPGLQSVREYIASYPPETYPADLKDEAAFIAALFHYNIEEFERAIPLLEQVAPADEELYLKSRYLLGAVQVRLNRAGESLEAFKDVLRHVRDSKSSSKTALEFESRCLLAIARVFYSTGDYETALRYYGTVKKYSTYWLDALFEASWCWFRQGLFERAMGNIHTLTSPYFDDGYFPEAPVVQAVILYTNCRYDDATVLVDQFVERYDGLLKELRERLAGNPDPTDFYFWLVSLSSGRAGLSPSLKRIFTLALSDRKLARAFSLVVALDREMKWLENTAGTADQNRLAERLLGEVITYRELALGEAGELARSRLDNRRRDLQRYLSQALRVKFESLNALKEISQGKRDIGATHAGARKGWELDDNDDYLPWPFWGEYWKDELDSYHFRVDSLCPGEAP